MLILNSCNSSSSGGDRIVYSLIYAANTRRTLKCVRATLVIYRIADI